MGGRERPVSFGRRIGKKQRKGERTDVVDVLGEDGEKTDLKGGPS